MIMWILREMKTIVEKLDPRRKGRYMNQSLVAGLYAADDNVGTKREDGAKDFR